MKPTVLIAEGDVELRDLYRRFLSDRNFEVDTASDGLECLAKLQRAIPVAILLDLDLKWGGGDGVFAWLRERDALSEVAVILTATAYVSYELPDNAGGPVVRFLSKPFSLTTLLEIVRVAVAERRQEKLPISRNRSVSAREFYQG